MTDKQALIEQCKKMIARYDNLYNPNKYPNLAQDIIKNGEIARIALSSLTAEPVAEIISGHQIVFVGTGPIGPIIKKHNLRVGDKLYTTPPTARAVPDGWIKCSDRLPSKGQSVIITDGTLIGIWRYRGWWPDFDGNGCASTSDPLLLINKVTLWMPLPTSPSLEEGNS